MLLHNPLLLVAFAGVSYAANVCQHHANTAPNPTGNAIHKPERDEQVLAGSNFEIRWTPTETQSKISIALLRGPRNFAEEFLCIANSVANTGSYSWRVPEALEADKSNYGLKLIVDDNGNYQYSDLFGIKSTKQPKKEHTSSEPEPSKAAPIKHSKSEHASPTESHAPTGKSEEEHGHLKEEKQKGHPKQKQHKLGPTVSIKPSKYYNSTIPHPTAHSSKPHRSSETSKHLKSTHTTKIKDLTSTELETKMPTSSNLGQVTSMVVASAPDGAAGPPPTVTTAAPPLDSPSPFPTGGAGSLVVAPWLLAGIGAVVAWSVL